jgi:hypothetical protein
MQSQALLVVHGIGTQQRGDTLDQCARGILKVGDGLSLHDGSGAALAVEDIKQCRLDHVRLRQGTAEVRLYEVYWADLLPAPASDFSSFKFEETTWFGWLNWKAGLLPPDQYSRALVVARTVELWLLQVLMSLALEIVIVSRKVRSTMLNRTAADVWSYVHSLAGELRSGSPLIGASERILERMKDTWERARREGSVGDEVQVIAHSLGTVVTYHAMARRLPKDAIHRLVTLGSPLEKVRFLWTKLFPPRLDWGCEWINFHTPSDPVSGKLKRFDSISGRIENRKLWGVGGYGEAHVGYFRDVRVMGPVAQGLGLRLSKTAKNDGASWVARRLVDVGVLVGMVLLIALGIVAMGAFFYGLIWVTGKVMAWLLGWFSLLTAAAVSLSILAATSRKQRVRRSKNRTKNRFKPTWGLASPTPCQPGLPHEHPAHALLVLGGEGQQRLRLDLVQAEMAG